MFQSAPGYRITTLCAPRARFPDRNFNAPRNPGAYFNCSAYDVLSMFIYMFILRNPVWLHKQNCHVSYIYLYNYNVP